jgi:hypothetical protein
LELVAVVSKLDRGAAAVLSSEFDDEIGAKYFVDHSSIIIHPRSENVRADADAARPRARRLLAIT